MILNHILELQKINIMQQYTQTELSNTFSIMSKLFSVSKQSSL